MKETCCSPGNHEELEVITSSGTSVSTGNTFAQCWKGAWFCFSCSAKVIPYYANIFKNWDSTVSLDILPDSSHLYVTAILWTIPKVSVIRNLNQNFDPWVLGSKLLVRHKQNNEIRGTFRYQMIVGFRKCIQILILLDFHFYWQCIWYRLNRLVWPTTDKCRNPCVLQFTSGQRMLYITGLFGGVS